MPSLSWLAPIIVFGIVVFIHELGHFIAAKIFGVYAPRFSIGFGPALWKRRRGETEYRIAAIPLGGYVRMASRLDEAASSLEGGSEDKAEVPPEEQDPNAMRPFGPKPIPENRWFESKPFYARLIIMLAGVTMNLLLGWAINIGLAKDIPVSPTTAVETVFPNSPADSAGLMRGDSIVSIDGTPIASWDDVLTHIGGSPGTPLYLGVIRDGEALAFSVTPAADSMTDEATGKTVVVGRIGTASKMLTRSASFGEAVQEGTMVTMRMGAMIFTALKGLVTREIPMTELGGPVMIAQQSVEAAKAGLDSLFFLMSLISINLAVFNLLPIPILDGGQIVIQAIEAIRRKPLSDRAREYVAIGGLVLIALLFITVTFNDIKRWLF